MRIVSAAEFEPTVRIANWFDPAPGMRWGPRREPDAELVLVHAGRLRYRPVGGAWQAVREREVLFIPAEAEHELELDPRGGRPGISCWHGELLAQGSWADGDYRLEREPPTVTAVGGEPFVIAAFRRLAEVYAGYGAQREAMGRDLVRLIWLHLIAIWQAESGPAPSRRLEPMLAWTRERLAQPIGRNQIAHAFGLTPQHVNALFRQGLDLTPGDFIRRERILRAWHDLHAGGHSVAEAAQRWGFHDQFHFSRVFRKVMGFPPSQAR